MRSFVVLSILMFGWAVFASGCPVVIKDMEFCRDKGRMGAVCATWLRAKETKRRVGLLEWNSKRLGMLCVSEKGMGNIRQTIETLCQGRECVEKTTDLVKALE